jgi:hypothetical protein
MLSYAGFHHGMRDANKNYPASAAATVGPRLGMQAAHAMLLECLSPGAT